MGGEMSGRLVFAIITTLIEEAALAAVFLVGLPELGIETPLWLLIVVMVAWAALAVFAYRMGSRALKKKPLMGLPSVVGGRGTVVRALEPEGLIRIGSELWTARTDGETIDVGEEVVVVGQDRTRLIVRLGRLDSPPKT